MNPTRKPKIFLSRTTKGLGRLADAVAEVLVAKGFEIVHQPDFTMSWRKIRDMLLDKIRDCDSALCLIGPAYGVAPMQPITEFTDLERGCTVFSYTQIEYLIARRLHKPTFTILIPGDTATFPLEVFPQTDRERELQSNFIRNYIHKEDHLYYSYSSKAELLDALRSASIPLTTVLLPPSKPENIPFPSIGTRFTGRADTLRTIRENLFAAAQPGPKYQPVQLIYGLGGVGKTRVTVEFAHAHAAEYSARLFLRGSSPGALDNSLAQLCGLFLLNLEEKDETDIDIRIQAVFCWLQTHRGYLIVIDNVDTEEARNAVLSLLPRLRHGHVLITTRIHTWPGDILRLELKTLCDTESADLLLGYRSSPKAPTETDSADALALAHDLGGLAIALEQAAAYLNRIACTIAEYHERWKKHMEGVHEWHDPTQMGYPASVATTWLTSFEELESYSKSLLYLLCWLAPDPVPRTLLRPLREKKLIPDPLAGVSPDKALGELINFSLAQHASGDAFGVHRLVQQITRERQPAPNVSDPTAKGFLKRLFTRTARARRPPPSAAAPPSLPVALEWVSCEFEGKFPTGDDAHSSDVRMWAVLDPLVQHAIAVANFAAGYRIPEPTARLLSNAALLFHSQANHRAAKPLYLRALTIDKAVFGTKDPKVASSLGNLAQLLMDTKHFLRAEPMMRRALKIDEQCFGPDHPKVAVRLNNLAQLLADTDRRSEAEPLMWRALAIDEKYFGRNHPNVAIRLNNLGQLLADTDRRSEAEPLMWRALAIDEKHFGPNQPNVAIRLNNLAQLLQAINQIADSEALMRRALAIDEKSLGPDHPDVAADLNNLAHLLQASNRLVEAEPLMHQALDIDERSLRSDHPKIATDLNNLAQLLQASNRLAEAEPLMRRALTIAERNFGPDNPNVAIRLNNLAQLLRDGDRSAEAEPLMRRALAIDEQRFGLDHPNVASRLNDLAQLLFESKRLAEAEPLMRRALAIDEKRFGRDNSSVAIRLNNLAQLLCATSRLAEAEPLMRLALRIDERSFPPDHPNIVTDLKNLALLLRDTNRLAEAESLMRRALTIDEQRFGPDHPSVATDLNYLAEFLQASNRQVEGDYLN